jgi:ADP-ribose pyrophosphatase YjhB (NUDIX family)
MRRAAMRAFSRLPRWMRRRIIHAYAPSYTVGAVLALIRSDGRILLVEQRHSPGWALPGGLLRRGEDSTRGLVREVAEEIGIWLDPARLPLPTAVLAPRARRVDVVFIAHEGDAVAGDQGANVYIADHLEVTGVGWFALDQLPEVSEPTVDILRGAQLL